MAYFSKYQSIKSSIPSCFFCGNQKPDPIDDYLEEFLFDLVELSKDGYKYNEKTFNAELHFFTCDTPVRVALKCIVGHTGYNAYERCNIKGNWVSNRVTFDEAGDFEMRTDEGFKNNLHSRHQNKESPLIQRNIRCIGSFVLDYMHLVCLGITRRILNFLCKGQAISRLSYAQLTLASEHLVSLRGNIPSSFARKPRTLFSLDRWKPTEFRQFLLDTGPLVLQKVLSIEMFCHFMSPSLAISILINDDVDAREGMLEYAATLLNVFVDNAHIYYGDTFNVYNVHNLKHTVDHVKHFNCSLDGLSYFKFENCLQSLKKMVKKANNSINQKCKQLHELEATEYSAETRRTEIMQLPLNCVRRKGFCLPLDDNAWVVFSLLHRI